jgi:hypothetical protein
LEFKSSKREQEFKEKLSLLQLQLRVLSEVNANTIDSNENRGNTYYNTLILSRPFPSIEITGNNYVSLIEELTKLADAYRVRNGTKTGENNATESVPRSISLSTPQLISIAEIQRCFQSFFHKLSTQLLSFNLMCTKSSGVTQMLDDNQTYRHTKIGDKQLTSKGNAFHCLTSFDITLMSFETFVLNMWNLEAKQSIRENRDKLKGLLWSIIVWLQSTSSAYYYQTTTRISSPKVKPATLPQPTTSYVNFENIPLTVSLRDELPRSPDEHEKSLLMAYSMMFGIRYRRPKAETAKDLNNNSSNLNDTDENINNQNHNNGNSDNLGTDALNLAKKMVPGPRYPLRDKLYGQIFLSSFHALNVLFSIFIILWLMY